MPPTKKPCIDGVERLRQVDVFADEIVGHAAAEPAVAACRIESQQMFAIVFRFADPQFADHAAFGKNVLHFRVS